MTRGTPEIAEHRSRVWWQEKQCWNSGQPATHCPQFCETLSCLDVENHFRLKFMKHSIKICTSYSRNAPWIEKIFTYSKTSSSKMNLYFFQLEFTFTFPLWHIFIIIFSHFSFYIIRHKHQIPMHLTINIFYVPVWKISRELSAVARGYRTPKQ